MTRAQARVWVEANEGGDAIVEAVRERLTPSVLVAGSGMDPLPVDVRSYFVRGPLEAEPPGAHPVYQHPTGEKCIWIEPGGASPGYWFIPTDIGGEGHACPLEHAAACLHDPRSYYFGFKPGELDTDTLKSIVIDKFVERIYLAPWVDARPPVHAAWLHQPTGATSPVCDRDAVGESVHDHVESVTCVACLRLLIQMRRLER